MIPSGALGGRWQRLRQWLETSRYLPLAYAVFLAGFFFMPTSHLHNLCYYLFVLLPFLLTLRRTKLTELLGSSIFSLHLLYLGLLTLSVSWSANPDAYHFKRYAFHFLYLSSFLALTIELCARDPRYVVHLQRLLGLVGAVCAVVAFVIFESSEHGAGQRLIGLGRLDETNLAATVYGSTALLALHYGVLNVAEPRHWRWLAAVAAVLCTLFLLFTESRGPQLAFVGALIAAALLSGRRWLTVTIVGTVTTYALLGWLDMVPLGRFASAGPSYRLEIWSTAWSYFAERPLLGHGQNFQPLYVMTDGTEYEHPHGVFLASLLYCGLIGTAVLVVGIVHAVRAPLLPPREVTTTGIAVMILFAASCMALDDYKLLGHPREIWLYFWLPVALAAARQVQR